jgi:hypothetical protein
MQFGVAGTDRSGFNVYTLIGLRQNSAGNEVASLGEAQPVVLFNPASHAGLEKNTLQYALQVKGMKYTPSTDASALITGTTISTVAFITDFAGDTLSSASRHGDLYAVSGTALNQDDSTTVGKLNAKSPSNITRAGSVGICFDGGTEYYAVLVLGSNGRDLTTSLKVINASGGDPLFGVCS